MKKENFLLELEDIITKRKKNPKSYPNSYTTKLFQLGIDRILKKIGEEATEFVIDAKNQNQKRAIEEAADLIFHLVVSLNYLDISIKDVIIELENRHKSSKKENNS